MMSVWSRWRLCLAAVAAVGLTGLSAQAAQAQEFSHTFVNPSFGGNPFNSDHLLAVANIHRPDEPEDPADPAPTPEELLISQLQAQLNSTLSSNIFRAIQTATVGQSGQFTLGDTVVSYVRTATETRVTFNNTRTGEVREIVIPVSPTGSPFGFASGNSGTGASSGTAGSAESILGAFRDGAPLSSRTTATTARSGEAGLLRLPPPL